MHHAAAVILSVSSMTASCIAQLCDTQAPIELISANAGAYSSAGYSVAASEDIVVIGAYRDERLAIGAGSAAVYRLVAGLWTEEGDLLPPTPGVGDWFGSSVATDGQRVVVGVPFANTTAPRSGSVVVFQYVTDNGWVVETELTAPLPQFEDRFGTSVAIDADRIVVGASQRNAFGVTNAGSALVYMLEDGAWTFEQELFTGSVANANAGHTVAIETPHILVGAPNDDSAAGEDKRGMAYSFQLGETGWGAASRLAPEASGALANYGWSVAINNNTALIGAPDADGTAGTDSGQVTVFELDANEWTRTQTLAPEFGFSDSFKFGESIAIRHGLAIVGMPGRGNNTGGIVAYDQQENGPWMTAASEVTVPNGLPVRSFFGTSVAVSLIGAVAGADGTDVPDINAGSAYIYSATCACPGDFDQNGTLNFFDVTAFIAAYNAGNLAADRAEPFGVLNFFDISAFISDFQTSCQ